MIATGGGDRRDPRAAVGGRLLNRGVPQSLWAGVARWPFVADGTALYYGGLDDFATLWRIAPREALSRPIASPFPRRFQVRGQVSGQIAEGRSSSPANAASATPCMPDGRNRAGPTLHKVFGRRIGTLPGYPYSDALRQLEIACGRRRR